MKSSLCSVPGRYRKHWSKYLAISLLVFLTSGFQIEGCEAAFNSLVTAFDPRSYETGVGGNQIYSPEVFAVVTDPRTGNVFIGGNFNSVDNVRAIDIAFYDKITDRWSALAEGGLGKANTDKKVSALAISGNYLYVGGDFEQTEDGVTGGLNHIARYNIDTNEWAPLGHDGVDNSVDCLLVSGNDLFVGGAFFQTKDGEVALSKIARYDIEASTWSALANGGLGSRVSALAISGNNLFVGGDFNSTGDESITLNNIGRYDTVANEWSPLAHGGLYFAVSALATSGNHLYVGGVFSETADESVELQKIAHYDITADHWSPLAENGLDQEVSALTIAGNNLYVGGLFFRTNQELSSTDLRHVARYDLAADTWSPFAGGGLNNDVNALAASGNELLVGGKFTSTYDGFTMTNIGGMARYEIPTGNLVSTDKGPSAQNEALMDTWQPMGLQNGNALNAPVNALAVDPNGFIYAAGYFTKTANGLTHLNGIARYYPTTDTWSPLANNGLNNFVNALAIHGDDLYVAGAFTRTDDGAVTDLNYVARYNLTAHTWSALPNNGLDFFVTSMAISGNGLYVGGAFSRTADGNVTGLNRIARYDLTGQKWSPVSGKGLDASVMSLTSSGSELYAGGFFTKTFDGTTTDLNNIARFDTASDTWTALAGKGLDGVVRGLTVSDTDILVNGEFNGTFDDAAFLDRLGRYDSVNNTWKPVTVDAATRQAAIATSAALRVGNDIYVGGGFTGTDNGVARYFTRIYLQQWKVPAGSTDWFTGSNWMTEAVPAAGTNAVVPAGAGSIDIATADVTLRDLVLAGGTLTVGAGRTLTVNGILALKGGIIKGDGTVVITSCKPDSIMFGGETSYVQTRLVRCVDEASTFNFEVGTANGYSPITVKNITGSGNISVKAMQGQYQGPAAGLPSNRASRWWQIENPTGGVSKAGLYFGYRQADIAGNEADHNAYRITGGVASPASSTANIYSNRISVLDVTSFSDWTLAAAGPADGSPSITGHVLTPGGAGLSNATVTLIYPNGSRRTSTTSSSGIFRFDDVETGAVIIAVTSRRYRFAPKALNVIGDLSDVDFTGRE